MRRTIFTLALGGILLLLGGCGGGAGNTINPGQDSNSPGPGGSMGMNQDGSIVLSKGPDRSQPIPDGYTASDQVSVRTAAADTELRAILDKFGYSIISRSGEFASVSVPAGTVDAAIELLNKEYGIFSAEKINIQVAPMSTAPSAPMSKSLSGIPFDPMAGEEFAGLAFNGTDFLFFIWPGQGAALNNMGFPGGFDLADNPAISSAPVRIAVIGAGFLDYTADPGDIDPAIIDTAHSGRIDGTGSFTAGLAAAVWETHPVDDGAGVFTQLPYHDAGNVIFQMLAAQRNNILIDGGDLNGNGTLSTDEIWNIGTAGLNPNAAYMIIRTGSAQGNNWAFTDAELAAAINYAADPAEGAANIIVLSMAGSSAIGGSLSTAIQNARNNDILVIAPAGDVASSYNSANGFNSAPVDIQVSPVSPGSDPNCVAVAAAGFGRNPVLPDVNVTGPPAQTLPNIGNGWRPRFQYDPDGAAGPIEPVVSVFGTEYPSLAPYSNYNADLAACGYAVYYQFDSVFFESGAGTAGDPIIPSNGYSYYQNVLSERFNTAHATAYAAGAASMVYQALHAANGGAYPADVDSTALSILQDQSDFAPAGRIDPSFAFQPDALASGAGLINVNKAMQQAFAGGSLFTNPMGFNGAPQLNQPLTAVTVGTPVQLTANVVNGTGPYSITVDWGDGNGPQTTDPWVPGTIISLPGGFSTLGTKALSLSVSDSSNQTITASAQLFVINPLTASLTVTNQQGAQVALSSLSLATTYIFEVRASNLYTGTYDHDNNPGTAEILNTTTFEWDFDGNGTTDSTGTAPTHAFTAPGTYNLTLRAVEGFRPDQTFTIQVTVQ